MIKSLGRITILATVTSALGFVFFIIATTSIGTVVTPVSSMHVSELDTQLVSAKSFIVFDVETGGEIVSKDATEVLPIASVTKLLTASLFSDTLDLQATTSITWSDVNTDGDAGRLHPYEEYSYRELMYPLLLESSNDAASAVLRVSPGLLEQMQQYVQALGMTQTAFADTSGLSDKNVSTAYELFLLTEALYKEYPHIFDITRLKQFVGTHTGWLNNNPLVLEEGYKGGKHGFTYEANRTDVSFFEEPLTSGQTRTIGYIILGSDNIKSDIDMLRAQVQKKVQFY